MEILGNNDTRSGFGLATMITPVMLLWLDPHLAIAAVAVVHAAHNGWKLLLLKTDVDFAAVKRYGWAMVLGALIGASLSTSIDPQPLLIVVGFALILLPLLAISERWTNYRLPEAEDRWGGFGSGFMGGLTGHQGALRAMFLQRRLPDKSAYAATAAIARCGSNHRSITGVSMVARPNPAGTVSAAARSVAAMQNTMSITSMPQPSGIK